MESIAFRLGGVIPANFDPLRTHGFVINKRQSTNKLTFRPDIINTDKINHVRGHNGKSRAEFEPMGPIGPVEIKMKMSGTKVIVILWRLKGANLRGKGAFFSLFALVKRFGSFFREGTNQDNAPLKRFLMDF